MIVFSYHAHCEYVYNVGIEKDKHILSPQYWLSKIKDPDVIMMTADDVEAFNENLMEHDDHVKDPLSFSKTLDRVTLKAMIKSLSSVPGSPRFYADGKQLTFKDYHRYIDIMHFRGIKEANPVQFGLVVHRAALRTFPTMDRVFRDDMDPELDRFQESALFPGETVVVLHTSKDKQWYYVRNYHNFGWIHVEGVALGSRKEVQQYQEADLFIVVTGDKIFTEDIQSRFQMPELQLDMGTRLALVEDQKQQNSSSYVVLLPVRNDVGNLNFTQISLPRHKDLSIGYLPFTRANILKQAFKFLGERYGWGHDFMARDCSGYVGEVYKTFGLMMPRNSWEQGKGSHGINYRFGVNNNHDDKLVFINQLEVGDLIFIPSHMMMYIGSDRGEPHVIQDTKGVGYLTSDGSFHRQQLNSVVITQLLPLYLSQNTTYVDKIYNIKRIRTIEYTCY